MTRWLSEQEQNTWRQYLDVIARHLEIFDTDLQSHSKLALTDFEILVMLSEAPGRQLRMSELAEKVIVSRSRLTYRVDRLTERDLVERVGVTDDRRGVLARLTDSGEALLAKAAVGHVETVRAHIFDLLDTGDLESFSIILDKLSAATTAPD